MQMSTGDTEISRLTGHWFRVQLTHVGAGVGRLNIAQDQLPRLVDVVDVAGTRHVHRRGRRLASVVMAACATAGVGRVTHRDALAAGDDHVVDRQDRLGVHSNPRHLFRFICIHLFSCIRLKRT